MILRVVVLGAGFGGLELSTRFIEKKSCGGALRHRNSFFEPLFHSIPHQHLHRWLGSRAIFCSSRISILSLIQNFITTRSPTLKDMDRRQSVRREQNQAFTLQSSVHT
jgi:hypothetical protein